MLRPVFHQRRSVFWWCWWAALTVLVATLAGARIYRTFAEIRAFSSVLAWMYLVAVLLVILGVVLAVTRVIRDYLCVRTIERRDMLFAAMANTPNAPVVVAYLTQLAQQYAKHKDPKVRAGARAFFERKRVTEIGADLLEELRVHVLQPLDQQAETRIRQVALQTALGTAASPVAAIDMLLVLWRNTVLVRDIAALYGYRPGLTGTWRLMRDVMATVAFAGLAELASDAVASVTGGWTVALSGAVAQGLSTGVLTVRIGIAARTVCRPVPACKGEVRMTIGTIIAGVRDALRGRVGKHHTGDKE
jgi:putative membrane protein